MTRIFLRLFVSNNSFCAQLRTMDVDEIGGLHSRLNDGYFSLEGHHGFSSPMTDDQGSTNAEEFAQATTDEQYTTSDLQFAPLQHHPAVTSASAGYEPIAGLSASETLNQNTFVVDDSAAPVSPSSSSSAPSSPERDAVSPIPAAFAASAPAATTSGATQQVQPRGIGGCRKRTLNAALSTALLDPDDSAASGGRAKKSRKVLHVACTMCHGQKLR